MTKTELITQIKSLAELAIIYDGSTDSALHAIYDLVKKEEVIERPKAQHPIADHLDTAEYQVKEVTDDGMVSWREVTRQEYDQAENFNVTRVVIHDPMFDTPVQT